MGTAGIRQTGIARQIEMVAFLSHFSNLLKIWADWIVFRLERGLQLNRCSRIPIV